MNILCCSTNLMILFWVFVILIIFLIIVLIFTVIYLVRKQEKHNPCEIRIKKYREQFNKTVNVDNVLKDAKVRGPQIEGGKNKSPVVYNDEVIAEMDESVENRGRVANKKAPETPIAQIELDGYE